MNLKKSQIIAKAFGHIILNFFQEKNLKRALYAPRWHDWGPLEEKCWVSPSILKKSAPDVVEGVLLAEAGAADVAHVSVLHALQQFIIHLTIEKHRFGKFAKFKEKILEIRKILNFNSELFRLFLIPLKLMTYFNCMLLCVM